MEIKEALGQEGLQFLGVQTVKWIRLPDSARVSVLLALSSPLANLSKARASKGWSSDIMTEILGASSIAVTRSPLVSTGASPARAEFQVWRGGMTIQGVSSNILLSVRIELKGGVMSRKSG